MTTPRFPLRRAWQALIGAAALSALAFGLWRITAGPGQADLVAINRQHAQQLLRAVCPLSRDTEQVRRLGASLTANDMAHTLIWEGPRLLYTSDPAFTAPAPLLTGAQRAQPGWVGWAEVDLPCGLSVQRFEKTRP